MAPAAKTPIQGSAVSNRIQRLGLEAEAQLISGKVPEIGFAVRSVAFIEMDMPWRGCLASIGASRALFPGLQTGAGPALSPVAPRGKHGPPADGAGLQAFPRDHRCM